MTEEQIARAQRLWLQGLHTFSIAGICRVPESEVYNRIEQIKKPPTQLPQKLIR